MSSLARPAHSTFSASQAERWMQCPASIALLKTVPKRVSSGYAEEGTAAHAVAALCLEEGLKSNELIGRVFNKFECTEDMAEAVDVYVEYICQTVERLKGSTLYVEHGFDLSWVRPDMWGTNDACISQPFGELVVVDYKHGQGVVVEVQDNSQLLYYALGALQELDDDIETVRMVIVQPRAWHQNGPIREWVVSAEYVREWGTQHLGPAVDRALAPGAAFVAGTHCKWCDAQSVCPELKQFVAVEAAIDFAEPSNVPVVPTAEEDLTRAMKALPVVEGWCRAVAAAAQQWLESGNPLLGFKLVRGKSNRVWKDEEHTIKIFKAMKVPAKDFMTKPKLVSPAQAEKLPKVDKETVAALTEKPDGKLTVAPDSDKRSEVPPLAQTDFEALPKEEDFLS